MDRMGHRDAGHCVCRLLGYTRLTSRVYDGVLHWVSDRASERQTNCVIYIGVRWTDDPGRGLLRGATTKNVEFRPLSSIADKRERQGSLPLNITVLYLGPVRLLDLAKRKS